MGRRRRVRVPGSSANLGPGFCIGHSFFASFFASPPGPGEGGAREAEEEWYRRVVETEVAPLLAECWFDDPAKAEDRRARLLA